MASVIAWKNDRIIHWEVSMLHKLKKHLILLYTASTGAILIVAMITVSLLNISDLQKKTLENFFLNVDALTNQLQSSTMLNLSDLAVLESSKHMIVHIEDSGKPISFEGSYQSKTERSVLIRKLQDAAILEGIHVQFQGKFNYIQRSNLIKITGEHKEEYYGYVVLIPTSSSFLSLTMLCSLTEIFASSNMNLSLYVFITFLGILGFYLISHVLIGKTLKPVQENQQRQVDFVASASHELRSPLAYIQTATSDLSHECIPSLTGDARRTLADYIKNTQEECTRMSHLIEDMLLLASADRNTWTIQIAPVDADTFFINNYDKLNYICNQEEHSLTLSLPDDLLGIISMDCQRVEQILQILINNANSYTPKHTIITLHPYLTKKHLVVEVIDHGHGIPDAEKERVFDRYYRCDQSRTQKDHFGLGLGIARELAHLHQGELDLTDTPGGGCTFRLSLPKV